MIQLSITIDVKPENFAHWKPEEMSRFFEVLCQLLKIKELADALPKREALKNQIVALKEAEQHLTEMQEEYGRQIKAIEQFNADHGIPPAMPDDPVIEVVAPINVLEENPEAEKQPKITKMVPLGKFEAYRAVAARYLKDHGPTTKSKLFRECEIPMGSTAALNHEWFETEPDGVHLTAAGFAALEREATP